MRRSWSVGRCFANELEAAWGDAEGDIHEFCEYGGVADRADEVTHPDGLCADVEFCLEDGAAQATEGGRLELGSDHAFEAVFFEAEFAGLLGDHAEGDVKEHLLEVRGELTTGDHEAVDFWKHRSFSPWLLGTRLERIVHKNKTVNNKTRKTNCFPGFA